MFCENSSLKRKLQFLLLCAAYNNYDIIAYTFATYGAKGRVPFDQLNFWKFRFKIEWNRKFPEIRFENIGSPLEVVLFSGNLEIPENSCSIWHFYPV